MHKLYVKKNDIEIIFYWNIFSNKERLNVFVSVYIYFFFCYVYVHKKTHMYCYLKKLNNLYLLNYTREERAKSAHSLLSLWKINCESVYMYTQWHRCWWWYVVVVDVLSTNNQIKLLFALLIRSFFNIFCWLIKTWKWKVFFRFRSSIYREFIYFRHIKNYISTRFFLVVVGGYILF